MFRLLVLLLGMLAANGVGGRRVRPGGRGRRTVPFQDEYDSWSRGYDPDDWDDLDEPWLEAPEPTRVIWGRATGAEDPIRPRVSPEVTGYRAPEPKGLKRFLGSTGGRRRISRRVKWAIAIVVIGLIFRKAIAFLVVTALSGALHLVGINVHLPHVKLAWPWTSITQGTTTDTQLGPWVLQKIEGISKPALGTENFNFTFTHKVTKSIGIWPCWYSSTFNTVGRASATVNLNPGPSWWTPASGHYRLQVLSRPVTGKPGRVSVAIALPRPQLPQSVHDITIDDTLSHPIDVQHSWTYPGLGCGGVIKPQFSVSVLYAQAQSIAFYQATHNAAITGPLIRAAENEANLIIRDNFVQPTLNALGYTLTDFTLRWG